MRTINKNFAELISDDGVPVKYNNICVGKAYVSNKNTGEIRIVIDNSDIEDTIKRMICAPKSLSISVRETRK